ncbi:MAG: hypothetical protein QMD94_00855, partial [Candidatus Omnitrophota bacterium]|nr:hypothetical protein [Candidatus Omnitrophota bacterium]
PLLSKTYANTIKLFTNDPFFVSLKQKTGLTIFCVNPVYKLHYYPDCLQQSEYTEKKTLS